MRSAGVGARQLKSFLVSVKQSRRPRHRPLFWTRAAGGVPAERREASAGLPSSGVETRARLVARVAHRRQGARAGAMASVEQYLTVLAGAQSAQNAEAQRLAAQMQIEVRLPRDRSASGHIVTRSIRVAATAPFRPPPRRVDRSIPSFSHLFRCARERKLALFVPRQSAFRFSGTRPSSIARRVTTEPFER